MKPRKRKRGLMTPAKRRRNQSVLIRYYGLTAAGTRYLYEQREGLKGANRKSNV